MIADDAVSDKGKNFGRLARTGIMDKYMEDLFDEKLAGIPIAAWQKFLCMFTESSANSDVLRIMDRMALKFSSSTDLRFNEQLCNELQQKFRDIAQIVSYSAP